MSVEFVFGTGFTELYDEVEEENDAVKLHWDFYICHDQRKVLEFNSFQSVIIIVQLVVCNDISDSIKNYKDREHKEVDDVPSHEALVWEHILHHFD